MKILILSDIEAGGEWIATQTLIEKLIKKDGRLKFYLITSSKDKYLLKESLFEKIIYIKHKYYKKPFKYYRELFYQLSSGKKAISHIYKQYKFDYVIVTNYILAISYLISQKKLNYIYYFHGIRNNYKIFFDTLNHFMIFQKLLEILAWAMSKKIIVPSIEAKTLLVNDHKLLLGKKSFVILPNLVRKEFTVKYSPLDISKFLDKYGLQNKKIILYVGRLVPNKGIENLADAFLKIMDKHPEIILVIAYHGDKNIKLINKIKYLKNLKTTDLVKLYQSSYLAVLPSPFEISSLFLREALTCNTPIITTDTGDSYKILSDLFILKDNKINTIYSKIIDYLKNKQRYDQSAKIMFRSWKKQYNEEKIINNWIKVLKNL